MAKSIGQRLIKTIRRKVIDPLRRHLTNKPTSKEDTQPLCEDQDFQIPGSFPPSPEPVQYISNEPPVRAQQDAITILSPEQVSVPRFIILAGQERLSVTEELLQPEAFSDDKVETLQSGHDTPSEASSGHLKIKLPIQNVPKIDQPSPTTLGKAAVTVEDPSQRLEPLDDESNGPGPSIVLPELPIMPPMPTMFGQQHYIVGNHDLGRAGDPRQYASPRTLHPPVIDNPMGNQQIQAPRPLSHNSVHYTETSIQAMYVEQMATSRPRSQNVSHYTDTSIQAIYLQQMAMYDPRRPENRMPFATPYPNIGAVLIQRTVLHADLAGGVGGGSSYPARFSVNTQISGTRPRANAMTSNDIPIMTQGLGEANDGATVQSHALHRSYAIRRRSRRARDITWAPTRPGPGRIGVASQQPTPSRSAHQIHLSGTTLAPSPVAQQHHVSISRVQHDPMYLQGSSTPDNFIQANAPEASTSRPRSYNVSVPRPQQQYVPVPQTQQHQAFAPLNADNFIRGGTLQAPRQQRRPANTSGRPKIARTEDIRSTAMTKEAWGLHRRLFRVRGAAESYARGFGLEIPSHKRPHVVLGCTFDAVQGTLMVNLCTIVSPKTAELERIEASPEGNKHLIPIYPNEPNSNSSPTQADFGDVEGRLGNHGWLDTSKVYTVPVDLIKDVRAPLASLQLCRCSWEKIRHALLMGTWAEEKFGIEREVKRFQRGLEGTRTAPDYDIRAADSLPEDEDDVPPQRRRPHLRRYQVEELLHRQ